MPSMMSYQQGVSKNRAFCSSILLFLSNSGRQTYLMVTISFTDIFLASVVSVAPFIGTVTIPFGKSYLWIKVFLDPESKSTLNNILLVKELIVLVMAIVAGV